MPGSAGGPEEKKNLISEEWDNPLRIYGSLLFYSVRVLSRHDKTLEEIFLRIGHNQDSLTLWELAIQTPSPCPAAANACPESAE